MPNGPLADVIIFYYYFYQESYIYFVRLNILTWGNDGLNFLNLLEKYLKIFKTW